jgi:uncharacterized membrane protein (UPF0127 family)
MGIIHVPNGDFKMKAGWIIGAAVIVAVIIILVLISAYYLSIYAGGINDGGANISSVDFVGSNGGVSTVQVEAARTLAEQEKGLMDRASMDEDRGMIFIFSGDYPRSFWMKDTILPLDMVFANSRLEIVDINHNATPYSESVFTSRAGCKYVIEVNGGYCLRHNVGIGDKIKINLKP